MDIKTSNKLEKLAAELDRVKWNIKNFTETKGRIEKEILGLLPPVPADYKGTRHETTDNLDIKIVHPMRYAWDFQDDTPEGDIKALPVRLKYEVDATATLVLMEQGDEVVKGLIRTYLITKPSKPTIDIKEKKEGE